MNCPQLGRCNDVLFLFFLSFPLRVYAVFLSISLVYFVLIQSLSLFSYLSFALSYSIFILSVYLSSSLRPATDSLLSLF